jgi:D-glycero-D-manno-heptose 1,7-bisphosphate phosphatase
MVAELRAAAFIDRDGVINVDRHYVHRIEDFEVLPGVVQGLRLLAQQGFALVVVTNQAGIARGLYTLDQYLVLTQHMRSVLATQGVQLDGVYHCPHHPEGRVAAFTGDCSCRKPSPGMLLQAAAELHLDLSRSVMIGDKPTDAAAGKAAGVRLTVLVESGHVLPTDCTELADQKCADLLEAATWVSQRVECAAPSCAREGRQKPRSTPLAQS